MKIEHVAYMVADPAKTAEWYVEHLGLRILRAQPAQPWTHFLADDGGQALVEIYNNPAASVPDYRTWDPLLLHLAFVSHDVVADRARLLSAGATPEGEIVRTPAGDELAMLRDPWGFAIQLCRRAEPMIGA